MARNKTRPVHPGEIIRGGFLASLGMSIHALAQVLHIPTTQIGDITHERRAVTTNTAFCLACYLCGNTQSWMSLQTTYDLRVVQTNAAETLEHEITLIPPRDKDTTACL